MRCNTGVSTIDKERSLTALQAACEPGASILVDKNPRQVRRKFRTSQNTKEDKLSGAFSDLYRAFQSDRSSAYVASQKSEPPARCMKAIQRFLH